MSHGRRKRNLSPTDSKTKEVPLQLAIVVRSLEEQEQIIASQSQIGNNDNNNTVDRSSRRLEAAGKSRMFILIDWNGAKPKINSKIRRATNYAIYI